MPCRWWRPARRRALAVVGVLALAGCTSSLPTTDAGRSADPSVAITSPVGLEPEAVVPDLLSRSSLSSYRDWIARLSGERSSTIAGEDVAIGTRDTLTMFSGEPAARAAVDWVRELVGTWVPQGQVEIDSYPFTVEETTVAAENIIVTLPGTTRADERVLLTAHLDAVKGSPGADDNASGSAALLEAVYLLRSYRFERTVQVIWFTGEEAGMLGSRAYVADHPLDGIHAVLNLDMIAYDSDGDRCMEFHVGTLPQSQHIGEALVAAISRYGLEVAHDFLTEEARQCSDHGPFLWVDVGAVFIVENLADQGIDGGCVGTDINPNMHTPEDTLANLDVEMGHEVTRLALATVADLAVPVGAQP